MYELLDELFPYIVAFYLLDGVTRVRPFRRVFFSPLGRRFTMKSPGSYALALAPLGELIEGDEHPIDLSRDGIYVRHRRARFEPPPWDDADRNYFSFADLGTIDVVGSEITRNGNRLVRLASPAGARRLAARLCTLASASPGDRLGMIDAEARASIDLAELRRLRGQHTHLRPLVQCSAAVFFAVLFVGYPALVLGEGDATQRQLVSLVTALAALHWLTVGLSVASLRQAGLAWRAVGAAVLPALMFPPAAAHMLALTSRHLYGRFATLALAAELLPRVEFLRVARGEYHRIKAAQARAAADRSEIWARREMTWKSVVAQLGAADTDILAQPARCDPSASAYCPICSAEYRQPPETCTSCEIGLVPFANDAAPRRQGEISPAGSPPTL